MSDKIKEPHAHDVLSGRGNFVNYHDGNEYFRKLVRKHKVEYVNCPKQQKGKFSKMIVDEIKQRKPSGRFLKQDRETKLWYDIGEKKALDKTRQALREGAPELMNNGKDSSTKAEAGGSDTVFNKPISEQQAHMSANMSSGNMSILNQSILSIGGDLGNESFTQGGGMMAPNPYNMQGIGLSPNMSSSMLSREIFHTPGGGRKSNDRKIDLSQVIPPPQVHQMEPGLLQRQKEQERQLQQLRFLQQQQQQQQEQQQRQQQQEQQQRQQQERQQQQQQEQRQSRQNHFTSQQEQEILRNATAVMGNDMQRQPQQQQQQPQPSKLHMDQLRINRLKEKRKLLEQQILHQRQLEILELKKLQNQQKLSEFQQQNDQTTASGMRGALQDRLGAVYAGTEAFLEPTPMPGAPNQMLPPNGRSTDVTGDLAGCSDSLRDRRAGFMRENSLKMESVFENAGGGGGGGGGVAPTTTNPKKAFNMSASGMSMSGTSLSLGFDEEGELSALFDTSMKIDGSARGYATTLNDREPPRSPKPMRGRGGNASNVVGNRAFLEMSLASMGKSNSSMSCDSSLSRLFDDNGTPSK